MGVPVQYRCLVSTPGNSRCMEWGLAWDLEWVLV